VGAKKSLRGYPIRMKANTLVWLTVLAGLVLALSATGLRGWAAAAVVAGALALAIPLSVRRFRQERNLVRTVWRALMTR
jgi:asparagine N-glycosylation enzyme membrane subunit Stt3